MATTNFKTNTPVYRETTLPLNPKKLSTTTAKNIEATNATNKTTTTTTKTNKPKKKRQDKSDLGENFIAPDGGWAWLVCIAAGISNLSIYPCLQQFGLLFRERMEFLGMTSSEVTSIINTNPAISACTGLLNGPMFRRFTFRQVAIAGSLFMFTGLMLTAFCQTFVTYIISYSVLYGFGMGISVSSSTLATNTYFKNKRRRAAGFSWTITGLGPIFLPYGVTLLLGAFGVQGTIIIFAALSLHSLVCALVYQPVRYHAPKPIFDEPELIAATECQQIKSCEFCELRAKRETSIFSSQYLYDEEDEETPGYEIIEPGTPMLSRANDGWYGSKLSLTSGKTRFRRISSSKDVELPGIRLNSIILEEGTKQEDFLKPNHFKRERDENLKHSNSRANLQRQISHADSALPMYCTCAERKTLIDLQTLRPLTPNNTLAQFDRNINVANDENSNEMTSKNSITFMEKVVTFFDLDLLRDFTFVNLVIGLTIINFGELNFSILTPFILNDFGFNTSQITLAMSVLAGMDITMRFLVPFLTEKMSWDNRVFFLIGVVGIALGRTVVACSRSFSVILSCFIWCGICKGVRTIFWPLIIPGYVPLKRLPAASGLQLLISGLFTLLFGPLVGLIRDTYDFSIALHCLNALSFIAAFSWTAEALWHRRKANKRTFVTDEHA